MAGASSREVLRHLNTLFQCGAAGQQSDEELLERFVASRDEAAEAAFAALVERHGAMVFGVCRRVLGNRHAAEDAFQATFLVLARKAAAIAHREQLASWLFGVARRAALDARARAGRQKANEKRLNAMLPVEPPDHTLASELRAILDEELARLPERHRSAIVLCELEGLSRREAAVRLGVSEGTLSSRLARAKTRLRGRLTRRGLALSAGTLAAVLAHDAHAVNVPPALIDSTIRVATKFAAGSSLAGAVSTSVSTLTEGVLKAMLLAKLKVVVLGLVTVALVTTGVGVLAQDGPANEDRLKSVERKLDRLLEVLGGSKNPYHATPPQAMTPVPSLPAAAAPIAPMPPHPPLPPGAVAGQAIASYPAGAYGISVAPAVPPPPPGGPQAHTDSLDGRVRSLEERISHLERRFAELERRISRSSDRPSPNPGSNRNPFEADPTNQPHGRRSSLGVPSINPAFGGGLPPRAGADLAPSTLPAPNAVPAGTAGADTAPPGPPATIGVPDAAPAADDVPAPVSPSAAGAPDRPATPTPSAS
jgi:RNA polymerase sigma factor (sigma-70 family)